MPPIETIWQRIETWLARSAPNVLAGFAPGATEQELQHAEAALGVELPEDLKALYRLHNGSPTFLDGWGLYSLDRMVAMWNYGQHFYEVHNQEDTEQAPTGPLRKVNWHLRWIPFMGNMMNDSLCLDMAPGPGGQQGQVILHFANYSYGWPTLLAPSLWWYLTFFATELEDGEYGLDQSGVPVSEERLAMIPLGMGTERHGSQIDTPVLIERVASQLGKSQEETALVVDALLSVMRDTLKAGEELRLVGFGSFQVVGRPIVLTTDPRTGEPLRSPILMHPEPIIIDPNTGTTRAGPRSPSVRFHTGTELRDAVSSA